MHNYQRHLLQHEYLKSEWIINSVSHVCHLSVLLLFIFHACHWCDSKSNQNSSLSYHCETLSVFKMCALLSNVWSHKIRICFCCRNVELQCLHPYALYTVHAMPNQNTRCQMFIKSSSPENLQTVRLPPIIRWSSGC